MTCRELKKVIINPTITIEIYSTDGSFLTHTSIYEDGEFDDWNINSIFYSHNEFSSKLIVKVV